LEIVAVYDKFGKIGTPKELITMFGLENSGNNRCNFESCRHEKRITFFQIRTR
jgi:hypothetical protein